MRTMWLEMRGENGKILGGDQTSISVGSFTVRICDYLADINCRESIASRQDGVDEDYIEVALSGDDLLFYKLDQGVFLVVDGVEYILRDLAPEGPARQKFFYDFLVGFMHPESSSILLFGERSWFRLERDCGRIEKIYSHSWEQLQESLCIQEVAERDGIVSISCAEVIVSLDSEFRLVKAEHKKYEFPRRYSFFRRLIGVWK